MFCQGNSTALAAVYGPREVRMNKELYNRASLDIVFKPKTGLPNNEARFIERLVNSMCENMIIVTQHPRTSIDIILQEMQNSGSYISCCLNAVTLALLDGCLPLKYTAAAVSIVINSKGELCLDPTKKQEMEEENQAQMTFVFDSVNQNVIACYAHGCYTLEQYQSCLMICQTASKQVFDYFREAMSKKLQQ
jgi:exosome complex component RRP46